jgi:hypothetical protein
MRVLGIGGYDWLTGGIVTAIGVFVVARSATYQVGSASHMGPGYFPLVSGILVIIFGLAIIFVEGRRAVEGVNVQPQFRALVFISLGLASFAALIERTGLVPAVMATTILCCLANKSIRPLTAVALAVVAAALASAIFVWGLRMPMDLIEWG